MSLNTHLPKYLAVAEWLKENIYNQTFKAGEKLMSENQLCQRFSISRQTARQAIAILEEEGLVLKKHGSGTYVNPIRLTETFPTQTIGVLIPTLEEPLTASIINSLEEALNDHDYQLLLKCTQNSVNIEREQLLALLTTAIDGLIVIGTKSALPNPNIDLYTRIREKNIPILFIHHPYPFTSFPSITLNDETGGRLAAHYLIEQGHQKITGIFKQDELASHLRYKGFLTEMYRHQLPVDESSIQWYHTLDDEIFTNKDSSDRFIKKLTPFTAIICHDDFLALQLIQLLNTHHYQVPTDFSIISFNDSPLCQMSVVPLTSLTHPKKELAHHAIQALLKLMDDLATDVSYDYQPTIAIRSSVSLLKND